MNSIIGTLLDARSRVRILYWASYPTKTDGSTLDGKYDAGVMDEAEETICKVALVKEGVPIKAYAFAPAVEYGPVPPD